MRRDRERQGGVESDGRGRESDGEGKREMGRGR